jgi:hypothetical protein
MTGQQPHAPEWPAGATSNGSNIGGHPVMRSVMRLKFIMDWFVLEKPKLWGDYGDVLIGGYYRRDDNGTVQLHRAGPFLPPLSIPWSSVGGPRVIVSDEFRNDLMDAGFNELEFRSTIKNRIIRLDWHSWNRTANAPPEYP